MTSEENSSIVSEVHAIIGEMYNPMQKESNNEEVVDICKQYLPHIWSTLGVDEIQVERMTGGLGSRLYRCKVETSEGSDIVYEEVVVRLHGSDITVYVSRFDRAIIALVMSQSGIGPKVFGLFEGGQVIKYYQVTLIQGLF